MTITDLPVAWITLVDAVLKATIVLGSAAASSFLLRRASAASRHLVWTLALCGVLALPVLSVVLPKWELSIVTVGEPATRVLEGDAERTPAPPLTMTEGTFKSPEPSSAAADDTLSRPTREPGPGPARSVTWQQALLAVWLLGAVVVLARLAIGLVAVQWLSRRTQAVTDAPWLAMAKELAAEIGLRSQVRFLRSDRANMPVAAGIFRPAIIMPLEADCWSMSRLRVVLLHELAHVKRRDCLTHLLAQGACALYWFNPLAWLAARRARAERERACDDLVLASGTRGSDYADQLLEMARVLRGGRLGGLLTGGSLAMAHQSQLEGRLLAILDPKLPRAGMSRSRSLAAVAIFCAAVVPLGALQPWTSNVSATPFVALQESAVPDTRSTVDHRETLQPAKPRARAALPDAPRQIEAAEAAQKASSAKPAPFLSELIEPVVQGAVDAVQAALDGAIEGAVAGALQSPKPDSKPAKGTGRPADPRMIAALTAALKDSDKEVRETAMHALVRLRDPAAFEPLVQALKDASPDVREQAVHGLSQLRDRRALEPLTSALKDDSADVREQAAFALGQLRDRSAVPALTAALKDSDADVREQAAFALGQLRDASAVDGLAIAVRDDNPSVREQAVFALSQIRDRRAVGPLISALKDSNAEVRQQAAFALGQLRDPTAVDALVVAIKDANADVREQIALALGQIRDSRAIEALTAALKDQSADVRRQAAFALGQLIR